MALNEARPFRELALEVDAQLKKEDVLEPLLERLGLTWLACIFTELKVKTVADLWSFGSVDELKKAMVSVGCTDGDCRKVELAFFTSHKARLEAEARTQRRQQAAKQGIALPTGSSGGLYAPAFVDAVRSLYDLHMGVENMAPLLYAL